MMRINFIKLSNLQNLGRRAIVALAVGIFIIVIYLILPLSFRADFSSGKAYTLASATKKILKHVDDVVTITFFVSSDAPAKLAPLKTDVIDLLGEYKKEGNGKLQIKILDPKKDQKALTDAKDAGIPELQFSQLDKDKYAVTSSYFGIALSYGDKKEIIPQVTDVGSLEYNLDAAIYKMTRKELPKVGIVGETEIENLKKVLEKQFSVESANTVDQSYKTLLVFAKGDKQLDQEQVSSLSKYLQGGGKVLLFIDGVAVSDNLTATPTKNNIAELVSQFGIDVGSDLILSTSAALVNFGSDLVNLLVPYPFWVKTNIFNSNVSYFSNINQLTFPWVSSISINKKEGIETLDLVKTTKNSWKQTDSFVLNPQAIPSPKQSELKEFIIAAKAENKQGGQIVVVPSSRFVVDRYLGQNSDNLEFVVNVANELATGGALSGIRQRAVAFYPLPDLSENQKDLFKYANIFLLPGLFGIFGLVRLVKRSKKP